MGTKQDGYMEADDGGLVPLRNTFLLPTAKLDDQKFEFYFLLDISGSMYGKPFQLASRAILLFLQSLPEDCYFNVLAFNDSMTQLFPGTVKYSQQTLEQARKIIPEWANLVGGDDNIHDPLQFIYKTRQKVGYLTQVFTLTDGYVQTGYSITWQQVIGIVKAKVQYARNFAIGIGGGVNREFVKQMAENSGGLHDFVDCSEQIESKVLKMLKVSLQPALLKPIRDASQSRLIPMYEP